MPWRTHDALLQIRSNGLRVYRGKCCAGCPLKSKCTTAKDGVRQFEFEPRLRRFQEQHWAQKKTQEYKDALNAQDVNNRADLRTRQDLSQPWQVHLQELGYAQDPIGDVVLRRKPGEAGEICS